MDLPAFDEQGNLNAMIETPQGSRNKYKYEDKQGLYKLGKILPAGMTFPFDFGFIPSTVGGDGDPVDVLVIMDQPSFTGCLVSARLIGVIEATQTKEGKAERNDRLIAVPVQSQDHKDIRELDQLSESLLAQIEHFFVSYHELEKQAWKPIGRAGADKARQLVEEGVRQFKNGK